MKKNEVKVITLNLKILTNNVSKTLFRFCN